MASLVPAVTGLAASSMLVVDYLRPAPVFCVDGGACEAIKHTVYATPMGIPLPIVGLVGFLALGGWSLAPGRRARFVQLGLAAGAGLVGMLLIVLQVLLGHMCPYCCVADASGLVALGVAAWRAQSGLAAPRSTPWMVGGASALAAAAAVPLATGFHANTTPPAIHREMAETAHGDVTVVDFVDFECPFCRMTNAELLPVLESRRSRIHLVRRQVPLHMHPHAQDAARAACCGEQLGKGDAMADALFAADVDELTPQGCEKIAASIGVPLETYRACVRDPATDQSIEADKAEFKAAGGYALPTIWVDGTPLIGFRSREEIGKVIDEALAKQGS